MVGDEIPTILAVHEEESVDLIVAGRKTRTSLQKLYVGSHTMDLLRRTPPPVLVYKYMVEFEREGRKVTRINDRPFDRPLLATDWSRSCEKALEFLTAFKGVVKKVHVAHVIGVKISKSLDKTELHKLDMESKQRLEMVCSSLKGQGIDAEGHLLAGRTAAQIVNGARDYDATSIVMGTSGKDRWAEFWLGSVSQQVAEVSELPVLLVP